VLTALFESLGGGEVIGSVDCSIRVDDCSIRVIEFFANNVDIVYTMKPV